MHVYAYGVYVFTSLELNSGCQACVVNPLPTEPHSHQPNIDFLHCCKTFAAVDERGLIHYYQIECTVLRAHFVLNNQSNVSLVLSVSQTL